MGDGGVACMPLRQHTNIMDRFSDTTTTHCSAATTSTSPGLGSKLETAVAATASTSPDLGTKLETAVAATASTSLSVDCKSETTQSVTANNGNKDECKTNANNNGVTTTSNGTGGKTKRVIKRIVKVKKVVTVKKPIVGASEKAKKALQNVQSSVVSKELVNKDEVEEGELGTLGSPPRAEVANDECTLPENSQVGESEEGVESKICKSGKGGGNFDFHAKSSDKAECPKDDIEKGELIPEKFHNKIADCGTSKIESKYEINKDFDEDDFKKKEINRSGSVQLVRSTMRGDGGDDKRSGRSVSKIAEEVPSYQSEYNIDRIHGRELLTGNRLKRVNAESGIIERKHFGDYGNFVGSKSRRLGDDGSRLVSIDYNSRHSVDKFYKHTSSSFRSSILDKYSRYPEPLFSSKVIHDRHGRSPGHSDHEKVRFCDSRDRTSPPFRRERSPFGRERSPYGQDRILYGRERSPYGRERTPHTRDKSPHGRSGQRSPHGHGRSSFVKEKTPRTKSPVGHEKSPNDRYRNYEKKCRSPLHSERFVQDQSRYPTRIDRTTASLARSKSDDNREVGRKSSTVEKKNSQNASKRRDDKAVIRGSTVQDVPEDKASDFEVNAQLSCKTDENDSKYQSTDCSSHVHLNEPKESSHVYEHSHDELISMEEDMDICDTPPHSSVMPDSLPGKWYYLDSYGVEQGPSKLFDLKVLVDDGSLVSDHFIKHMDSDRWVTIEKAVSPLVNFSSIASESITQLVSPPEAPGNLLRDSGDAMLTNLQPGEQVEASCSKEQTFVCDGLVGSVSKEEFQIDERVGALLDGFQLSPGTELETIGEALQISFEHVPLPEWKNLGDSNLNYCFNAIHQGGDEVFDEKDKVHGNPLTLSLDTNQDVDSMDITEWISGLWSCKGGDWKRQDDGNNERCFRKKLVLNDCFPLCQMPKAGYQDPRWQGKDDLYYPSQSRRLDLPMWAFSCIDEKNDGVVRSVHNKPPIVRGVKGTTLPVIRINACVVKDHGSFLSEPRPKARTKDRHLSRLVRHSGTIDVKRTSESDLLSQSVDDQESNISSKLSPTIEVPKDRLCTVHDLHLYSGEWFYVDGAGHEHGPRLYSELQSLVDQGIIPNLSSVYRKSDKLWVPVSSKALWESHGDISKTRRNSTRNFPCSVASNKNVDNLNSFHGLHPQFLGYMRGKLHELVMKSYKSRDFSVAINEVLDPWISAKVPKRDTDKNRFWKSDVDGRALKRLRGLDEESSEETELDENVCMSQNEETSFDELCDGVYFPEHEPSTLTADVGSWGLLDGNMLARIFHFLRYDMRSLTVASLTCKHWRTAVTFYKDIAKHIDFSSLGSQCTDSVILNVMNGYNSNKIKSMVLLGCTRVTPAALEQIIRGFPFLSSIDVRGCSQFMELIQLFPNVVWLKSSNARGAWISEDSRKNYRRTNDVSGDTNDFNLTKYIESSNKRDLANQSFRGSLYMRSKLFDARNSSSIVSRDARTSRWSLKKSEIRYKRMEEYRRIEEFITMGLKDIMKLNSLDFFVAKVAEIEERLKTGYYLSHGFNSVKNDIVRMCKESRKARIRGSGDVNNTVDLFFKLASHLGKWSKSSYDANELSKVWKEDLIFWSSSAKLKKLTDKKSINKNNSNFANGNIENSEGISERDARKGGQKWNKKCLESGSDYSDEFAIGDSENSASDTESDSDFQPDGFGGELRGDGYFTADESCVTDEREWGARMTKASLVPPVTRKYEVIDHYIVVADEEDVKRKMSVSLPDDYAEKLDAQKNGPEELDMELPEVKDYKPRKVLGDEVIEQEVYGIDPYTHNLLLDSMPKDLDWTLLEKHTFIEDLLLRMLNKQVREFTGTGNTPMMYPLQPVIEEIEKNATTDFDERLKRICQCILKAIESRREDNYVAYRKGLGVVCHKDGGFEDEDFVVEFLGEVYPAWKWFEKQDGIRSLQKDSQDPAPEFYNIYLERPKGDADGYDLVVVDAMHKANYASRICHSCKPNCLAKVTVVDGQYQIGIYTTRGIQCGEEITFDYNSVTESKEEYEASVCLCGSQVCRGSYLNLTGEGAFQKVLKRCHGILDRHRLMVEACQLNFVSEDDYLELGRAGLGSCLLGGLPKWVVAYSARLVRFINWERTKLPKEILKHNLEEKRKYFSDISMEVEKSDAEVQAEGVYNQRLQNLTITLDKVRYVMRCLFGDPKTAPPPLEELTPEETVSFLWTGEESVVHQLLRCMAPHVEPDSLCNLRSKIQARDPLDSDDICKELQKSLLWLRDELRNLPCTDKYRHDAAADLIHVYAYTKFFFRVRKYMTFSSPPVSISPLDLGPKYADKLGPHNHEYQKTYGENYCLGQLIYWHILTNSDPDCTVDRAIQGCLSLPLVDSFYSSPEKPPQDRTNSPRLLKAMLERMEKYPQKSWPKDEVWSFKKFPEIIGSPMMDALLNDSPLDKEMMTWLRQRPSVFQPT